MTAIEFLSHPVAKYSALAAGDKLIADNGFDCIESWSSAIVEEDDRGEFYVACKCGRHVLEGQLDFTDNDTLVGFRRQV